MKLGSLKTVTRHVNLTVAALAALLLLGPACAERGDVAEPEPGVAESGLTTSPTVKIVAPLNNAKFEFEAGGTDVEVKVSASGIVPGTKVRYYLDGAPLESVDHFGPFVFESLAAG